MAKRSKARELAMQMLFQVDMNPDIDAKTVLYQIQERLEDEEQSRFAWLLFAGTREHCQQIDARIASVAKNWSLSRMAATDRNLLRLGCFELDYHDTPASVVIDEMIELAKKFGGENSSSFVNGVLDKLAKKDA
jgi:N utilization substance protein B